LIEYWKERKHFFEDFPYFFKESRYFSTGFRFIAHSFVFLNVVKLITNLFHCFRFKLVEFPTPSQKSCLFMQPAVKVSCFEAQNATNSAAFLTNFADISLLSLQIF
jgi:hypothetical protein